MSALRYDVLDLFPNTIPADVILVIPKCFCVETGACAGFSDCGGDHRECVLFTFSHNILTAFYLIQNQSKRCAISPPFTPQNSHCSEPYVATYTSHALLLSPMQRGQVAPCSAIVVMYHAPLSAPLVVSPRRTFQLYCCGQK